LNFQLIGIIVLLLGINCFAVPSFIYGIPIPSNFLVLGVLSVIPILVGLFMAIGVFNDLNTKSKEDNYMLIFIIGILFTLTVVFITFPIIDSMFEDLPLVDSNLNHYDCLAIESFNNYYEEYGMAKPYGQGWKPLFDEAFDYYENGYMSDLTDNCFADMHSYLLEMDDYK